MKKRYFIPLFITIALFGVFLGQKIAFGATLYSQTGIGTEQDDWDSGNYFQILGNGLSGHITSVCIYGKTSDNTSNYGFSMAYQSAVLSNNPSGQYAPDGYVFYDGGHTFGTAIQEYCQSVDYELDPSKYYCINAQTHYGHNLTIYGSNNSNSWLTSTYDSWYYYGGWNTFAIKDLYFKLNGTPPPSDEVNFVFPTNAITTPNFYYWRLSYNYGTPENAETAIIQYSKDINLTIATSSCVGTPYFNNSCFIDYFDTYLITSSTNRIMDKNTPLSNGVWYAKAFLLDNSFSVVDSTSINFQIIEGDFFDNYYWGTPTSTITTSTPVQITCDPNDPFYQYSLCKLFSYLFVPSTDAFNKFTTLANEIENKPPIGYFTQIKAVLSGINSSGTPVFDIGNYSAFSSIFNPLRTGLGWLLWLFFAVVIFNRIRHLDL